MLQIAAVSQDRHDLHQGNLLGNLPLVAWDQAAMAVMTLAFAFLVLAWAVGETVDWIIKGEW